MEGRLEWFHGPFYGNDADLTICKDRFDKEMEKLQRFAIGDSSYRGLNRVIKAPKTFGHHVSADPAVVQLGRILHSPRALIESFYHRNRCWRIMDAWPYREEYQCTMELSRMCAHD